MFRMAPLHHHFELKGWDEITVVIRFWIITGSASPRASASSTPSGSPEHDNRILPGCGLQAVRPAGPQSLLETGQIAACVP